MKALLLIDLQNDFMPGGALGVSDGDKIVPIVNELQQEFDLVVATQDWHPEKHASFASNHPGQNTFDKIKYNGIDQVLWPDHCVQNSKGAQFHSNLKTTKVEAIFRKGMDPEIDSYSGFFDNAHLKSTGLSGYLKEKEVETLYICGLAGDFCVYFSAKDALSEGFSVFLIDDAVKAIEEEAYEQAKVDLLRKGAKVVSSKNLGF